jgi:prepilin-type N-terminal cleavage/methylation domain-containing protein
VITGRSRTEARGVTLLELLVVLMILSLILTAAVKTWDVTLERGRVESTRRRLDQLATAITGNPDYVVAGRRADFGFVGDMGRLPNTLADLAVAPVITPPESSRWRGPYLRAPFNESPQAFRIDGWGDSIAYNTDSMLLRSYGGRGLADRTRWTTRYIGYTWDELMRNVVDGAVVDVRGLTPPASDSIINSLRVVLEYPFEGKERLELFPGSLSGGQFTFSNIPQGSHLLRATYINFYRVPAETTEAQQNVTVYPGIGARDVRLRLNVDWSQEP